MSRLVEFLFPAPAPRRAGAIVRWWEARRLPYNLMVGAAGLASLAVIEVVSLLPWMGGGPPWIPWQPIVAFGVLANLCYLLGPALEIALTRLWGHTVLPIGPALFRMGLTFSVGLALFPALLAVLVVVAELVGLVI